MIAPVVASTVPDGVAMLALPSVAHCGSRGNDRYISTTGRESPPGQRQRLCVMPRLAWCFCGAMTCPRQAGWHPRRNREDDPMMASRSFACLAGGALALV